MPSPTTVVSGPRATWGVSDCGQLMGQPTEAGLASIEPEGVYEHLAIGVLEEGYTLAYVPPSGVDTVKYDVYESSSGITCVGATSAGMTETSSSRRRRARPMTTCSPSVRPLLSPRTRPAS
jgi:hypothetical protein